MGERERKSKYMLVLHNSLSSREGDANWLSSIQRGTKEEAKLAKPWNSSQLVGGRSGQSQSVKLLDHPPWRDLYSNGRCFHLRCSMIGIILLKQIGQTPVPSKLGRNQPSVQECTWNESSLAIKSQRVHKVLRIIQFFKVRWDQEQ